MKWTLQLAAVAAALGAQAATAGTFSLDLAADNGSRWYDYFSDSYAELGAVHPGGGDGFFLIGTNAPVGTGVVVFPNGGNFLDIGDLSYNDITGAITSLTLDVDRYVADNDALSNTGYATSVSNVVGTVTQANGLVSGINLTADITFTYDTFAGLLPYTGTFTLSGNRFDLQASGSHDIGFGAPFALGWNVTGDIQNLTAVPEPSAYALVVAGLLAAGTMAKRRRPL